VKDKRLTQKQIDRLMVNPHKIELEQVPVQTPTPSPTIAFRGEEKDYDTLKSVEQVKTFCLFIKELITHYEENQRRQEEAETMELDLEHCIELAQKLTEKEKKSLYQKLTDVLQTRRACKSENEILAPFYNYFNDKILLNKLNQLQGTVSSIKDIVTNRTYSCRTNILDDFRTP
jgi:hypothetical protein